MAVFILDHKDTGETTYENFAHWQQAERYAMENDMIVIGELQYTLDDPEIELEFKI